jgi:transposase
MGKLIWPTNSSGLNPLENLWKIVRDLLGQLPRSTQEQARNYTNHSINMGYNVFGATPNFD